LIKGSEMQDVFNQNNMNSHNNQIIQNNQINKNKSKREAEEYKLIEKNYEALTKVNRFKNVQDQNQIPQPHLNQNYQNVSLGVMNINNSANNSLTLNINNNRQNIQCRPFKLEKETNLRGDVHLLPQNNLQREINKCRETKINSSFLHMNDSRNTNKNSILQTNNCHAINYNNNLNQNYPYNQEDNTPNGDVDMKTISATEEDLTNNLNRNNLIIPPSSQEPHEEYLDDIYKNILLEELYDSICDYMPFQDHINPRMRIILIEWLVDVSIKFKLRQNTVFLTVHLIDRYLSLRKITRSRYQLLGACCLLIACKFEEIYFPELRDIIYICDKTYSGDEIIRMESEILRGLDYKIVPVSPSRFLQIIAAELKLSEFDYNLCNLMLELVNFDYDMVKVLPSLIACTTVYITFKIKKLSTEECNRLLEKFYNNSYFDKFPETQIKECAQGICALLDKINLSYFRKIKEKYSLSSKFLLFIKN
jgi:hypothetical protein